MVPEGRGHPWPIVSAKDPIQAYLPERLLTFAVKRDGHEGYPPIKRIRHPRFRRDGIMVKIVLAAAVSHLFL
jgi:hypothetical protein